MIHHPDSPYKGKHYTYPVELIDIYPTITDLLSLQFNYEEMPCRKVGDKQSYKCHDLQGKSLAKVVLGSKLYQKAVGNATHYKRNLIRGTPAMKRITKLGGNETELQIVPLKYKKYLSRGLRSRHVEDGVSTGGNSMEWSEKEVLNYYYRNNHIYSDNNTTQIPQFVADFFSHKNYFYLSSISYHNTSDDNQVLETRNSTTSNMQSLHSRRKLQANTNNRMPKLEMNFAISQLFRCTYKNQIEDIMKWEKVDMIKRQHERRPRAKWFDCDRTKNPDDEFSVMGYSMRTIDYRYTAWFQYNRKFCVPILDLAPYDEEVGLSEYF